MPNLAPRGPASPPPARHDARAKGEEEGWSRREGEREVATTIELYAPTSSTQKLKLMGSR